MMVLAVPLTFVIGAGASLNWPRNRSDNPQLLSPALDGFSGLRIRDNVAIGGHARFSPVTWKSGDSVPPTLVTRRMQIFDVGPALQVESGRWYFEGWLGLHLTRSSITVKEWPYGDPGGTPVTRYSRDFSMLASYGVLVGVAMADDGYRPSLYLEVQRSTGDWRREPDNYTAVTLGVALRY